MPSVPGLHGNVDSGVQFALAPLPLPVAPLLLLEPPPLLLPLLLLLPAPPLLLALLPPLLPPLLLPLAGPLLPDEHPIAPSTERVPPVIASRPRSVLRPTDFMGHASPID
jgi:hypothetical protein